MPGWVEDLLKEMFYGPFYQLAKVVWDWCIGLSTGVISQDPQHFSPGHLEICNRYSVSLGNGNRFIHDECIFHLRISKSSLQLKRKYHVGTVYRRDDPAGGLKCVDADGNAVDEDPVFHGIPDGRNGIGFPGTRFFTGEVDAGSVLFWWFMGFLYFFIALICGMLIFLTLFSRYVKLYLLTVTFPLAMPSMVSGRGIDETAKSWVRSFLGNVFEIVVIALVMSISGRIIGGMDIQGDSFADFFDGFGQALTSSIYMIGMAVSVRGARSFMKETFHL